MKKTVLSLLLLWREKAWWITLTLSLIAGFCAQWMQLPAAWLIGPLVVSLLLALKGWATKVFPVSLYHVTQVIIGTALSAAFQPTYLINLGWNWVPVLAVIMTVLLLSVASGIALMRINRLAPGTAILGAVPGAASGMIAMSDELGGDARVVAFMQYARLIVVTVLTSVISHVLLAWSGHTVSSAQAVMPVTGDDGASPLVGYAVTLGIAVGGGILGRVCRLPAGSLIGPMLVGVVVGMFGVPHGVWPSGVLQVAYVLVGIGVGVRFDRAALKLIGRLLPFILLQITILVVGSALCGLFLAWVTGTDVLTGYLATNPGGLDAVTITALDTGANLSLVLATQLLRFFSILLVGPPIIRWLAGKVGVKAGP